MWTGWVFKPCLNYSNLATLFLKLCLLPSIYHPSTQVLIDLSSHPSFHHPFFHLSIFWQFVKLSIHFFYSSIHPAIHLMIFPCILRFFSAIQWFIHLPPIHPSIYLSLLYYLLLFTSFNYERTTFPSICPFVCSATHSFYHLSIHPSIHLHGFTSVLSYSSHSSI